MTVLKQTLMYNLTIDEFLNFDEEKMQYVDYKFMIKREISHSASDPLLDGDKLKKFIDKVNFLRKEFGAEIEFYEGFTPEQAIEASRKVNTWADKITSARIDGQELSPLEKYFYALEIVTEFKYKLENADDQPWISRDLISVLNSDCICCVGYASLMREILDRLNIPCEIVLGNPKRVIKLNKIIEKYEQLAKKHPENKKYDKMIESVERRIEKIEGHASIAVLIKDEKYSIDEVLFADPTANSIDVKNTKHFEYENLISFNQKLNDSQRLGIVLTPAVDQSIEEIFEITAPISDEELDKKIVANQDKIESIERFIYPKRKIKTCKRINADDVKKLVSHVHETYKPDWMHLEIAAQEPDGDKFLRELSHSVLGNLEGGMSITPTMAFYALKNVGMAMGLAENSANEYAQARMSGNPYELQQIKPIEN